MAKKKSRRPRKRKKRTDSQRDRSEKNLDLTYAEALEAVAQRRVLGAVPLGLPIPPYPDSQVDPITQVKLNAVTVIMMLIGQGPGDFPVAEFDRPVEYRRLQKKSLDWLEQYGIPARQTFAPLAAKGFYIWQFGDDDRLPVPAENAGLFFGRLIHFLLIETQIITAKQYYHGLGLYQPGGDPLSIPMLNELFPPEAVQGMQLNKLLQAELNQMHGRIFLDYCVVMLRAQWDKLLRLTCLTLGLDRNFDSISDGLKAIEQKLDNGGKKLHPWCNYHLRVLIEIAKERLFEDGWIKEFRDHLLHDVGPHSAGVVPHKKSLETTSELWDRMCNEHDALREATMAALAAFLSVKMPESTETPPCHSGPIPLPSDPDKADAHHGRCAS